MNSLRNTTDNTISIKPSAPVDAPTFARLRAAGFAWRMASGEFIAPDTESARAIASDMAGQIEISPALQASDEDDNNPSHARFIVGGVEFEAVRFTHPRPHWRPKIIETGEIIESGVYKSESRPKMIESIEYFLERICKNDSHEFRRRHGLPEQTENASGEEIDTGGDVVTSGGDLAPFNSERFYSDLRDSLTAAGWTHDKPRERIGHGDFFIFDNNNMMGDGAGWSDWRVFVNQWTNSTGGGSLPSVVINAQHKTAPQVAAEIIAATTPGNSGEQTKAAESVKDSGEQKPTPPKIQTVERRARDGVTRVYLAHLPKGCTELHPLTYSQPGVQALRIAKLRAAGISSSAHGMGIVIDPSGEVPPSEAQASSDDGAPLIPGRWIPGGADKAERIACDVALGAEVWLTDSSSRPGACAVIAYSGKRTKRDAYYTMPDGERAQQWAADYIARLQQNADQLAARNAEKKAKREAGHKLKLGDVLRCSWGYDQTNIDYYEVTRLLGKSMVEIRPIAQQSVESGHMTGECVPRPGHYTGEPMRKTVSTYDGQSVRIASYASAYKIEPHEVGGVKVWLVDHWTAYA